MRSVSPSTRLRGVQALRGVAILLVVFFHLRAIEAKYAYLPLVPTQLPYGLGGLDLFFVISGFITAYTTRSKFQSLRNALLFLYDRFTRIYPLYWLISLPILGVLLINSDWVNAAQNHQVDLIRSFLLLPSFLAPLLNVGWSLVHQLYFYLVFALFIVSLDERHLALGLLAWALVVALGQGLGQITTLGLYPAFALVTHPLTYEFILGCVGALYLHSALPRFGLVALVVGMTLYTLAIFIMITLPPTESSFAGVRILAYGLPATLVVYGTAALELAGITWTPAWLSSLGDWSFSIYLLHVPVMTLLGRLWLMSHLANPPLNVLALGIILGASIVAGKLCYRWIELTLIGWSRRYKSRWNARTSA